MRAAAIALALLAFANVPVQADPYVEQCPAGGPPCVSVTLVEHITDLYPVEAVPTSTITVVDVRWGDLVVEVDGLPEVFRGTFGVPRTSTQDPYGGLDRDVGVVHTHFELFGTTHYTTVRNAGIEQLPKAAEVWFAQVEVRVNADTHYVLTVPIVVPVA
jgi:hypothetical protein